MKFKTRLNSYNFLIDKCFLAEKQGFEPWEQLPVHRISSAARLPCLSVSYRICSKVSLNLTLNFTCSTHN